MLSRESCIVLHGDNLHMITNHLIVPHNKGGRNLHVATQQARNCSPRTACCSLRLPRAGSTRQDYILHADAIETC